MSSDERIAELEARIRELESEQDKQREATAKLELDQWQARIDDLQVQLHLVAMDVDDSVKPLLETLRNRWLDARAQAAESTDKASDVISSLSDGLEQAMKDIRDAVMKAKTSVMR